MSFLLFALSAPSVVLGQYYSQPNYGQPVYQNPMAPAYQNPTGFAGPQAPLGMVQADCDATREEDPGAYVDPSKIKEMTEDNVRKIEAAIGEQKEKARIASSEQKEDIQSLVEHDIKIKSDRIDADLQRSLHELHGASNARKAALMSKGGDTIKLQFAEIDQNLEQTFAQIDKAGQQQIYEALEAQSALTTSVKRAEEKKKERMKIAEARARGGVVDIPVPVPVPVPFHR